MKKKVLCTALAVTTMLTQTASATPWQWHRNELTYDSEIGFFGNVTLTFASDGGSFISPKQVADILGHTTSQITEMYYVKKDTSRLNGITDGFEI